MNNPVANPVLNAAFRRAFMLSVLTGAVTALTARQQDQTWEDCLIAGIIVLLTTLIARGGFEGGFDANRALNNNVNRGDVPMAAAGVTVTQTADAPLAPAGAAVVH
jgi:hypothetical protein